MLLNYSFRGKSYLLTAVCFQSATSLLKLRDKNLYHISWKTMIRLRTAGGAQPHTHACPFTQAHSTLTLYRCTHIHTSHPVWGHFALHSSTSIFHLHNREGAVERRKALHEIIKDPAGMQQHSSRCPILSNRSNESCPSDH